MLVVVEGDTLELCEIPLKAVRMSCAEQSRVELVIRPEEAVRREMEKNLPLRVVEGVQVLTQCLGGRIATGG